MERRSLAPYLLVVPVVAALVLVEVYPFSYTLYLSLVDFSTHQFVGVSNYLQLASSGNFWGAVLTSLFYSMGSTALAIIFGVLLAFQVSQLKRWKGFFESVYLAPLAVAPIVVGVMWAPSGVWDDINTFWHYVLGQPFFNSAAYGFFFPVMVISEAYEWAPLIMLVALGIMASVPKEVYEAASLHGGSTWQIFRRISLPAILRSPVMQFVIIIRFIDAMRAFEIPFTWSTWISYPQAGSPLDTLSLLLFKLFTTPTYNFPIGYISAVAITLIAGTLGVTVVLFRVMNRSVKL